MSSYDSYGEDIAGQAYSSYADTPGDAGGNDNFTPPTTIRTTNPTDLIDVAPPPSQRLNLIDRLSGGIQGIKDYFGDPDRQTGIFSGLVGSTLFGPFAGIAAGMAGQRFASRNNNLLTGMNTIDYNNVNIPPFTLPETKPFFIDQDIRPKYASFDYRIGLSNKTIDAALALGINPNTGETLTDEEIDALQQQKQNNQSGITKIKQGMMV